MDNDHQVPEEVHSNGDEALFALRGLVFHVNASGSLSTPSASESGTPCFLIFAAFFFGSKLADT